MTANKEILFEIARSRKALNAARILAKADLLEDSISRAYYSVLHAAKTAPISTDLNVDSHDAVKRLFGKYLVSKGEIEKEYSIILRQEQDDRLLADYDVSYNPEKSMVDSRIADAETFLQRIISYLHQHKFQTG